MKEVKEVWRQQLREGDSLCTFPRKDTFILPPLKGKTVVSYRYDSDIHLSYSGREVILYNKGRIPRYRGLLVEGCVWGPGTLIQKSDMTFEFWME